MLLLLLLLRFRKDVLQSTRLVHVEGQVFLKFLNLGLLGHDLIVVLLSLLLELGIRLHKVVVEFDELLHLIEGISSNLG